MITSGLSVSGRERRELQNLLGELQGYLESVIDCHTICRTTPELGEANPEYKGIVSRARRVWVRAENWVKRLEGDSEPAIAPPESDESYEASSALFEQRATSGASE